MTLILSMPGASLLMVISFSELIDLATFIVLLISLVKNNNRKYKN